TRGRVPGTAGGSMRRPTRGGTRRTRLRRRRLLVGPAIRLVAMVGPVLLVRSLRPGPPRLLRTRRVLGPPRLLGPPTSTRGVGPAGGVGPARRVGPLPRRRPVLLIVRTPRVGTESRVRSRPVVGRLLHGDEPLRFDP